jgi:two-component system, NtrC family, sensor histidine kinase HydH
MKFLTHIQPRYIIAISISVALLMFGSAFIELHQSRNELLHVLREHSLSLAETIERSSSNVVLSTEQVELQMTDRLLNNAFYIAQMDSAGRLTQPLLQKLCSANSIYRINIVNRHGIRILGSHMQRADHASLIEKNNPREILRPILNGETDHLIIGLKEARFEEGQRFAIAIKRTNPAGGAIVLNVNAQELLEFRKRIGIGKFINDLSENTGIDYVVIQDSEGILAASKQVKEISSIEQDILLTSALHHDSIITRQVSFHGHESYEVVRQLSIEGSTIGLLRIGLSMDELRSAEARMTRRILIMSIVLVALGILVFTAIVVNQHYQTVSQKYNRIQSFTGSILEHMHDAVITINAQNQITLFNRQAEALFDTKANDVLGKKSSELSSGVGYCLSEIFSGTRSEAELTLECSGGHTHIVSISLSSTDTSDGSLESQTAVIKDLTESRRLEREIQRKEKLTAMGELASGVAHEIRNPLNAISMIAQRYEKEFTPRSGSKEYRSLTHVLQKEASRVNNIIQQFLRFARPPKTRLVPVQTNEFVSHLTTLFEGQAKRHGIYFSARCSFNGAILIDRDLLTQAILNLLQNSLDATPTNGSIELNVLKNDAFVHLEVRDTGAGISREQVEKIFDLYYTTKKNGTGIGLAITQQIVSQHTGHIQVESVLSKGTVFTISLPLPVCIKK